VFEKIRSMFDVIVWDSWQQLYEVIIDPYNNHPPNWLGMPIIVVK
jgi:hypothetical protein